MRTRGWLAAKRFAKATRIETSDLEMEGDAAKELPTFTLVYIHAELWYRKFTVF